MKPPWEEKETARAGQPGLAQKASALLFAVAVLFAIAFAVAFAIVFALLAALLALAALAGVLPLLFAALALVLLFLSSVLLSHDEFPLVKRRSGSR
jgi:hypothetical protein